MRDTTSDSIVPIHIACWACYIGYELGANYYVTDAISPLINIVAYYTSNIGLFYSQLYLLNRTISRQRPAYLKGILLTIALILVFLMIKVLLDCVLWPVKGTYDTRIHTIRRYAVLDLLRCINFIILSTLYWSAGYLHFLRGRSVAAENAYLRQQINPHLLFNTLNFIYNAVLRSSEAAANCVRLLADIMRYGLSDAPGGKVPLEKELVQIRNLVEINRLRFNGKTFLEFRAEGNFGQAVIPPVILLTLTENIFKHGNLTNPDHPAKLDIRLTADNQLTYASSNLKKRTSGHRPERQTGLRNTLTRLELAYPGRFRLVSGGDDDFYQLTLTIQL